VGECEHPQRQFLRLPVAELAGGVAGLGEGSGDFRRIELDYPSISFFDFQDKGYGSALLWYQLSHHNNNWNQRVRHR